MEAANFCFADHNIKGEMFVKITLLCDSIRGREYGKVVEGVDVCKFGKQWIVSMVAMKREYGEPRI